MQSPILEARGLMKRYGKTQALAGLDLAVNPGRVVNAQDAQSMLPPVNAHTGHDRQAITSQSLGAPAAVPGNE